MWRESARSVQTDGPHRTIPFDVQLSSPTSPAPPTELRVSSPGAEHLLDQQEEEAPQGPGRVLVGLFWKAWIIL